ncbi:MAG: nucleoside triphosphate pyrophosphatase [Chlamydiota bacterium]|nr:nucleoside triphosphate pyrophosphatase [Chlamydiota bacterium]
MMIDKPIILGSQSPRRKEILGYFSIPFEQVSSDFDEESIKFLGDPQEFVHNLSYGKALAIEKHYPQRTILTADTIVYREEKIYGKPTTENDAFQSLSELVGRWHSVYTGVTLVSEGHYYQGFEETKVLFNVLNDEEIRHYHRKIHWSDKAGGYAIQMAGGLLVKRIDGCYYNVMGLPINTVRKLLSEVGVDLWHYL